MSTSKAIKFAAPYTSKTFNDAADLLIGYRGVVSGGKVTTSGPVVTIQPLTFIQNGLFVTSDIPLTAGLPAGLTAPYFVAVTTSSSVENLAEVITPTFVKRPEDVSANTVLVAEWGGAEWRPLPKIQLKEILDGIALRAVKQNFVGISSGLDVAVVGPNVVVQPGSLIDRTGALITKELATTLPIIADDADGWGRIDEILHRRPVDDSARVGTVQYVVGQTYDPSGADATLIAHTTAIGDPAKVSKAAKTLINSSNNDALFLYLEDYGARQSIVLQVAPDGLASVGTAVVLATDVSYFDAVINPTGNIELAYTRGNNLYHATFTQAGVSVYAETLIAGDTVALLNPKLVTIKSGSTFFIHVVYERVVSGSVHNLMYARVSASNTIETVPSVLVNLSALLVNPSIDKDDDDSLLLLAFENNTTGRVYLRQYDAGTATNLAPPTQIGTPLELEDDTYDNDALAVAPTTPASKPIVKRAANKTTFVFWRQFKGSGKYGVAIYSPNYINDFNHKAVIPVLTGAGENILDFDVALDGMNFAHFSLHISGFIKKASVRGDDLEAVGTSTTVAAVDPATLRLSLDARGALIHTWALASSGYTNNGTPLTAQFFGPGTYLAQAIGADEVVFLQTAYNALPAVPTTGDKLVVAGSGAGNNGTYDWLDVRTFVSGPTYTVVKTSAVFTSEGAGPTAQFQVENAVQGNFAKSTAGVSSNLRGFYVTPSDIYLAHYRTEDGALAVSGTALEEDQTVTRLYEFFNTFGGASGQLTWQIAGANKLVLASAITLNVFNRRATYTIPANGPSGITVGNSQVAYVVLPDEDVSQNLTLLVEDFGAGILDRYGKRAFPLFWNIGGYLYMKFAPWRLESGGETIIIGSNISQELQDWLGISSDAPDPNNHGYTSTTGAGLLQSDNPIEAISKLDAALGGTGQVAGAQVVRGGNWSWNSGTGALAYTTDAFIQVADYPEASNKLALAGSPIILPADGDVAYVNLNLTNAPTTLTPIIASIDSVVPGSTVFIIARRVGATVLVGEMLLQNGESKELGAGLSIQNRELIGGTVTPITEATSDPLWATRGAPLRTISSTDSALDATASIDTELDKFFGQLRLTPHETNVSKVRISGVDKTLLDSAILSQELSSLLLDFDGAVINFQTGTILKSDDLTALGINFTPFSVPASQYFWYGVSIIPSTVGADNRISAQVLITPASSANAVAASAPYPVIAGTKKLGAVRVFNNAGTIENEAIRQLGTGSGSGGGAGDVTDLEVRLNIILEDSPYNALTPSVFKKQEDDLVDGSSTGSYDIANGEFDFGAAAQTLVSKQLLDAEYLAQGKDIATVQLEAFWRLTAVDTLATYAVSRDGGVNWQTITMARNADTDEYSGLHTFTEEVTPTTISENPLANDDANLVLNASTTQRRAQPFTLTDTAVLRSLDVEVNKTGSPTGKIFVRITADAAGFPSTNLNDVLFVSKDYIDVAALSAGIQVATVSLGALPLVPGTYHIEFVPDAEYLASFSAGVNEVAMRADSSAPVVPDSSAYNGTVWSAVTGSAIVYLLEGRLLDLRVRVTAGGAGSLTGFGIFFDEIPGLVTGQRLKEQVVFDGGTNPNEFTLTNFAPDRDYLKVYEVETGQVYVYPAFTIDGQKVIFSANTFNDSRTYTLVFDQSQGVINTVDGGSAELSDVTVASNVGLQIDKMYYIDTNAARTLGMPAPIANGRFKWVDKDFLAATNNITFTPFGGEKLHGVAANYVVIGNGEGGEWRSNGTDWFLV